MKKPCIKILLVDDDEDAYVLTRDMLEETEIGIADYQLDWVGDYGEALTAISRNEHEVYLLDYRLGQHNGLELLNKVHNHCPEKVAILLTGYGDHTVDVAAMKAGAADYWVKDQINGTLFERSIRYAIERKRAERLERERNSLRAAAQGMEQVIGVLGHELRTPLASLRAMSEYLMTEGAVGTPEFNQFLESINQESIRMADMVGHMLEAARLESGLAKWNWSKVSLQTACEDALEVVRHLIDTDKIDLSVQVIPPDLTMKGDADAVRRLLINLLTNAHKHTSAGFIRVTASAVELNGTSYVQLKVQDSGEGIPAEIVEKLGTPFALNSGIVGGTYVKGSGLGLSICRGIVAVHGGSIDVESTVGDGSTFTVVLQSKLPGPVQEATALQVEQEQS